MSVIEITTREFRSKQRTYLELADKGERIVIRRGRNQSYLITPMESEGMNMTISPVMEMKINQALQELKEEKTKKVRTKEELKEFLDSL